MSTQKKSVLDLDEEEEELVKIPLELVQKLQNDIRAENKYNLEETRTRNVLIVGRTRSGKSTAVGVLKDPCYEPHDMSIFSDTFDPKFQSFALDDKTTSIKYTLNVIDTPGLKEVTAIGDREARSDKIILGTINYCLKNEITKINTLLIFISFELGVTADDLDSFSSFIDKFGHDGISIVVCITRSETKGPSWKKQIQEQLSSHQYFSEVLKKGNVHICFLGCVDGHKNNTITKIDDLRRMYARVYKMRTELLSVIFEAENQVKLVDLPIASGLKKDVLILFDAQEDLLKYLEAITDFDVAIVKQKISEYADNLEKMGNQEFLPLLMDPDLNNRFQELKLRMKPLSSKMNETTRQKFIGRLLI